MEEKTEYEADSNRARAAKLFARLPQEEQRSVIRQMQELLSSRG